MPTSTNADGRGKPGRSHYSTPTASVPAMAELLTMNWLSSVAKMPTLLPLVVMAESLTVNWLLFWAKMPRRCIENWANKL